MISLSVAGVIDTYIHASIMCMFSCFPEPSSLCEFFHEGDGGYSCNKKSRRLNVYVQYVQSTFKRNDSRNKIPNKK